jgi:hypothetical protein
MLVGRILSDIGDDKPLGLMRRLRAVNDRIIIEIDSQVSMALSIAEFPESDLLIDATVSTSSPPESRESGRRPGGNR